MKKNELAIARLREKTKVVIVNGIVMPERSPNLAGIDLSGLDLSGAVIRDANFTNANLSSAKFHFADLRGCTFALANLRNCDLRGCDLQACDFTLADMTGAKLSFAKFRWNNFAETVLDADIEHNDLLITKVGDVVVVVNKDEVFAGAQRVPTEYWIENYFHILRESGFSEDEIKKHSAWLQASVIAWRHRGYY